MVFEPVPARRSDDEVIAAWQRPIAVAEYHQMIDVGVFDEDDRLELLEGALVRMRPQSLGHARVIEYLTELLVRAVPARCSVRCQLPLTLARSEPEPDFAIVLRSAARNALKLYTTPIRSRMRNEIATRVCFQGY